MNVIIAAGGTAGHVNPALAIAQYIKQNNPDANITFVGRQEGMEYSLVTKAGYDFRHMEVTGFQRKINAENIKRNMKTMYNLLFAEKQANKILKELKPDLVIGTGGYVSGPILLCATKKKIKTAIHEQNAFAGMTNKILSKKVDMVFVATEDAVKYMADESKCIVCGNPVRQEIENADEYTCKKELGLEGKTVLLSFGGSLGARAINTAMKAVVKHNKDNKEIVHHHVVGRYDEGDFEKYLEQENIQAGENLFVHEYLYDIHKYMSAADIIISRCGALTIAEIACMGKASILIPSPNVSENHQYYNGKVLTDLDAGIMIEEKDLNEESIVQAFDKLYQDKFLLKTMGSNAKQAYNKDCIKIIYDNLFKVEQ